MTGFPKQGDPLGRVIADLAARVDRLERSRGMNRTVGIGGPVTAIPSGVLTPLVWTNVVSDPYGLYDVGTGEVTFDAPGMYSITAAMHWDGAGGTATLVLGGLFQLASVSGAGVRSMSAVAIVAASGAVLTVLGLQSSGAPQGGGALSSLTIARVGDVGSDLVVDPTPYAGP